MAMQRANFDYSLKNIPIPHPNVHMKILTSKTESFLQRIRWKVHFFLNPSESKTKETFGFKTVRNAPPNQALINFEHDLTHLIANLEYNKSKTPFQKQLIKDAKEINKSNQLYVSADKTSNIYKMTKEEYKKLLRDNVTSHYQITSDKTEEDINCEARRITDRLQISDRVEPIAHKQAYITIKDHKENFPNNVKCRLINPAKTNIGQISKNLLQDINQKIREETGLHQWRSTQDTLNWFKKLQNKTRLKFIQLDIIDFYPSINESLFEKAIDFASQYTTINADTKQILHNARQSLLFSDNKTWKKKSGTFDVTMGSYDGCEVCELVGLYILHRMKNKFPEINFGLYRDDGLGTIKRTPKTKQERMRKDLHELFKQIGLRITCDMNLTSVNFLDTTLDLHNEKYSPYKKPNDQPLYVHRESNHPPHIAKQIPTSICKRLSTNSHNVEAFESVKKEYEEALGKSGYSNKLTFQPPKTEPNGGQKNRSRNVIWYTPPYCASLKTNFGKEFLKLIDKHFPVNNILHKIINRKSVKLGYSCTPNMQSIINNHNRKILKQEDKAQNTSCNCQNKDKCPIPGKCTAECIVYKATVQHEDGKEAVYIGATKSKFKLRHSNHKKSFRHVKYKNETTLSTHIWQNNLNPNPKIRWEIVKECTIYSAGNKLCDLCLTEKFEIIRNMKKHNNINKRTDLGNRCPHLAAAVFKPP